MTWTTQDIKTQIAYELHKYGGSLEELESELKGGQVKTAANTAAVVGALKSLGTIAAGTAATAGIVGGAGLYGVYKGNQDSNDKIDKKMQERQQYIDALNSLRAAAHETQTSGMR